MNLRIVPKNNLQSKLMLSLLLAISLIGVGSLFIGWTIIDMKIIGQAHETATKTLDMYGDMYDNKLYVKHRLINTVASYSEFQRDVAEGNKIEIFQVVKELLKDSQFDVLNVTDAAGNVLVRSRNFAVIGDSVAGDPYIKKVLRDKSSSYGFDVESHESLLKESELLALSAVVSVQPTLRSRATARSSETRGMMLKAASPVFYQGKLVGVIYGALLLNNDFSIPDRAESLVFGNERIDDRPFGTATLFLEDMRISTNVRNSNGQRAIGTLASKVVFEQVFENGTNWNDRAFVVDRYYIAAYKPIRNIDGKTIGMIYTGILEEKYDTIKRDAISVFVLLILIVSLIVVPVAFYLVHRFINPITALVDAAKEVIDGGYRKVDIKSEDEMGYLGFVFNKMIDALIEKDRRLMENVEKTIQQTEKLASLGRLSSGIAHEINNPLTGVLAYSCILLEDLRGSEHEPSLNVIIDETLRCRDIVKGMLDFARETRLEKVTVNLNRIIKEVLLILEKHVTFQNVKVIRNLDANLPELSLDINQMKSVINNLAVNAADSMPDGGSLTVTTRTFDQGSIEMIVSDTGTGIDAESLEKVFDPFFTTKETGKGTGLGLSVTYGIVQRHQGLITISSEVGVGTMVRVQLPVIVMQEVASERVT